MKTSNKSFWELITDNIIDIPIIQRDYAQGRDDEKEKRDKFLDVIYKHLINGEPLDLDFVYGRLKGKVFYPIDGQQRLTTLFLLHWYISLLENIDNSLKGNLVKFVYDTRISSREFCKILITKDIKIPLEAKDNNFIIEIQNNHWFREEWKNDPTIKSMLTMIQSLHEKFNHEKNEKLWDKLTNNNLISFQVLDLGAKGFELTDELYIKMNARGKQLTPFETFKANFIQFLERTFKDKKLEHPIKGNISYAGYFSYKVEKEWTDLFWVFREDVDVIDTMFMNYFGYISQMCYFQLKVNAKADDFVNTFKQYEEIFKVEDNLIFLFNSLDKIYDITFNNGIVEKERLQAFFSLIFQKEKIDNTYDGEVRLFWNSTDFINLFENCINKGLDDDARNKIIFYCIIHYLLKTNSKVADDDLKRYVRVIRNLIQATRQRNETKYNTNIRINYWGSYWILFKQLATKYVYQNMQLNLDIKSTQISENSLKNEKLKANIVLENIGLKNSLYLLEESPYFEGLIHQLKPQDNLDKLTQFSKIVNEIWDENISDTFKIQALIACGFNGVYIKDCKMGETWYFGKAENWQTVLTIDDDEISTCIIKLLTTYLKRSEKTVEEKLQAIIDDWFNKNAHNRSWKYYFLKYPEFTSNKNYYVFGNDYEIRMLGTESSNPLIAYHISPYVLTVCNQINNEEICEARYCYQQYTGNSPLILKNGMTLTSTEGGWIIDNITITLSTKIVDKYKLIQKDNQFILHEIDPKDRIEIACDFINELVTES